MRKINNKKQATRLKTEQRTWTGISPENVYNRKTSTWKDVINITN